MQVVILAGGLGTRLRPLTYQIPKPLVPVHGKPFLEYQLELLKKHGLKDVILCVGYLGNKIKDYFGKGEKIGLDLSYSFEEKPLGTGGALKNAQNILEDEFLLMNGDTFLDFDYQDLISYFYKQKKMETMVVFKNQPKIMLNNVTINDRNKVINYNKKMEGKANCVDAGIQIFRKSVLDFIPENEKISLEEKIFPILIKNKEMIAFPVNQRFYDIGTFKQLKKFNQIL